MELTEIIILNEKEYTVTLNRESIIHIERYSKSQESLLEVSKPTIDYVDRDIQKGENPFAEPIDEEKFSAEVEKKEKLLINVLAKAFWIWLYPKHKMEFEEVHAIIKEYMQDDESAEFISEKYLDFINKSYVVRQDFIDEQKNLKAQATKKN